MREKGQKWSRSGREVVGGKGRESSLRIYFPWVLREVAVYRSCSKLLLGLILFPVKLLANISFFEKRKKQEMAANEFKLFITVCALFRDYDIYNVGVWEAVFKLWRQQSILNWCCGHPDFCTLTFVCRMQEVKWGWEECVGFGFFVWFFFFDCLGNHSVQESLSYNSSCLFLCV